MSRLEEKADELRALRAELGQLEIDVVTSYTLADAIREGCQVTEQEVGGFGNGVTACAMTAAVVAAKSRGWYD